LSGQRAGGRSVELSRAGAIAPIHLDGPGTVPCSRISEATEVEIRARTFNARLIGRRRECWGKVSIAEIHLPRDLTGAERDGIRSRQERGGAAGARAVSAGSSARVNGPDIERVIGGERGFFAVVIPVH